MHEPIAVAPGISAKAALWAAIIAGIVFMMLEMIMVPVFMGGSPWGPPRMIAAIGMGKGVLPPPATFDEAEPLALASCIRKLEGAWLWKTTSLR